MNQLVRDPRLENLALTPLTIRDRPH